MTTNDVVCGNYRRPVNIPATEMKPFVFMLVESPLPDSPRGGGIEDLQKRLCLAKFLCVLMMMGWDDQGTPHQRTHQPFLREVKGGWWLR